MITDSNIIFYYKIMMGDLIKKSVLKRLKNMDFIL